GERRLFGGRHLLEGRLVVGGRPLVERGVERDLLEVELDLLEGGRPGGRGGRRSGLGRRLPRRLVGGGCAGRLGRERRSLERRRGRIGLLSVKLLGVGRLGGFRVRLERGRGSGRRGRRRRGGGQGRGRGAPPRERRHGLPEGVERGGELLAEFVELAVAAADLVAQLALEPVHLPVLRVHVGPDLVELLGEVLALRLG